jgi:hypothetical protein
MDADPGRFARIDSSLDIAAVGAQIVRALESRSW